MAYIEAYLKVTMLEAFLAFVQALLLGIHQYLNVNK